jgi:hypothetical protein
MESALRESLNRLSRVARRESAHAIGPEDESKQIIAKIQVSVVAENLFVRFLFTPRSKNENKLCPRTQTN